MTNKPIDKTTTTATSKPVVSAAQKPVAQPNQKVIQDAIKIGKDLMSTGKIPKSEASMVMYRLLHEKGCDQEVIVDAFVKGASLTPMGARTYFYNCRRKYEGEQKLKQKKVDQDKNG